MEKTVFAAFVAILSVSLGCSVSTTIGKDNMPGPWEEDKVEEICRHNGLDRFNVVKSQSGSAVVPLGDGEYTHYLTLNMVAVNGSWFTPMKDRDLKKHFRQVRAVLDQCGIDVRPGSVSWVEGSEDYDRLDLNENKFLLGIEEECLYSEFHEENEITVYFMNGIRSEYNSRSHSRRSSWFDVYLDDAKPGDEARQAFDSKFVGSVVIIAEDINFGDQSSYVMPHEIGHILFDEDHDRGLRSNILSDRVDGLSNSVTPAQCRKAKDSPFVHRIE